MIDTLLKNEVNRQNLWAVKLSDDENKMLESILEERIQENKTANKSELLRQLIFCGLTKNILKTKVNLQ